MKEVDGSSDVDVIAKKGIQHQPQPTSSLRLAIQPRPCSSQLELRRHCCHHHTKGSGFAIPSTFSHNTTEITTEIN